MSGDSMIVPDQAMVDSITSSLEYLNNKTEWVYSADMDVKALEFGNVGEKFSFILEHDAKMLFFSLEVPEVLMGSGNIAEGLGQAQSEMWKLNIASKQADVEKVIEQNIYKKILNDQGINEDVEFHWGEPSTTEKEKMITLLTSLIPLNLSPGLHVEIEKKLATMIGASEDSVETEEERQDRLMNTQLPQVPGQFGGRQMPNVPAASKGMGMRGMKEPEEEEEEDEEENYTGIVTEKDHSIKEWVGFNYEEYKKEIIDFLRQYSFDDLAATTAIELEMGYLTMTQIEDLRKILIEGFNTGQSIREIAKNIKNVVNPGALYSSADQGAKMLVNKDWRPIMIARTETVLAANMGSINNYKANGVEEYRWIASTGKRTCPQCQSLNGKIFTIGEGPIPAKDTHPNCRCTTGAVVRS
jgi:SPP1 gp7 family putative phage head morphogenesis protein